MLTKLCGMKKGTPLTRSVGQSVGWEGRRELKGGSEGRRGGGTQFMCHSSLSVGGKNTGVMLGPVE